MVRRHGDEWWADRRKVSLGRFLRITVVGRRLLSALSCYQSALATQGVARMSEMAPAKSLWNSGYVARVENGGRSQVYAWASW